MSKILKNTIYYSIGEIAPRIISFLLLPILTTYLTTVEYGINSYTSTVMTFVFIVGALSLNTFVLRNYFASDDENERKKLIGSIFIFICIFNLVLVLLQMLFLPFIIHYFKINIAFNPYFLLSLINNFFDVISILPLVLYRVKEDARGFLILSLSRTILQFILTYVLVVVLGKGLEGSYYARLIVNIPFLFLYFHLIRKSAIMKMDYSLLKNAIQFSLPLLPGSLAYLFASLSDRIVLERYVGLNELGIYSVAATLALVLNIVIQSLYKTFEPVLFREFHNDNFDEINLKFYKIYLCILIVAAFATACFSKEFFLVATSANFLSAYKIVPFLLISVIISGINTYLNILMITLNKQKLVSVVSIISGGVSVALNLILIPILGFYGAIIASTISFLIVNAICHYNVKIKVRYFFSQLLLVSIVIAIPYYYDVFIPFTSLIVNIVLKSCMVIVFGVAALFCFNINMSSLKNTFIK
jgi:O-antigen/teichoic acid export membrane protein